MDFEEMREKARELKDAMKRDNGGKVGEYESFSDAESNREFYILYHALENFLEQW